MFPKQSFGCMISLTKVQLLLGLILTTRVWGSRTLFQFRSIISDMTQNTKVTDYGDQLVSVPRAHLRMELLQTTDGLFLTHEGKSVLECYLTEDGMLIAGFIAKALGVNIPAMNQPIPIRVSTGVLYRALGISYLDLHNQESYTILERLLEEAAMQRRGTNESL